MNRLKVAFITGFIAGLLFFMGGVALAVDPKGAATSENPDKHLQMEQKKEQHERFKTEEKALRERFEAEKQALLKRFEQEKKALHERFQAEKERLHSRFEEERRALHARIK